jgi:class 3 adenylate cyclase
VAPSLDELADLARFVPALLLRRLAASPARVTEATLVETSAAVFFSDIKGFTALSEQLSARAAEGIEELSRILNGYFGQLIDVIHEHGGDVLKFAGDALLAWWPAGEGESLAAATRAAALCALRCQEALAHFTGAEGPALTQRIGVGAGSISVASLGGVHARWELVAYGAAVLEATRAAAACTPGETIAGPAAWGLVSEAFEGDLSGETGARLLRGAVEIPVTPLARPALSAPATPALLEFLPAAIRPRLAARQSAWLAEWRRLTVLFLNLPEVRPATPLAVLQTAVQSLQEGLYRYEGSLNKLSVDDKGVTLVAAFGLPPLAHEDDAHRGVRAALEWQARLARLGWRGSIGITTGRVFCGIVGCATRCEYTIVGSHANLAARLMQAAGPGILCDEQTVADTSGALGFETLPPATVKGRAEPVPVFRPLGEMAAPEPAAESSPIFGRKEEQRRLREMLEQVVAGQGGLGVVEGEAGVGKSRLAQAVESQAGALGISVLHGFAESIEHSTAYFGWRHIFRALLAFSPAEGATEAWVGTLAPHLGNDEAEARLTPLLNVVLPAALPENRSTLAMSQEARVTSTNAFLARLLARAAAARPLAVIIEDGQWLDSASWSLIREVAAHVPRLFFLLVTRPFPEQAPREYLQLLAAPGTLHLRLAPLSGEETRALVRMRLGIAALPEAVARLIEERAQGNPFYAEELAFALRDSGLLLIAGGACELVPGRDVAQLDLPETVQGVVTSRIDRLTAEEQLTLKVASVIGAVFPRRALGEVHPIKEPASHWPRDLETLGRLDLIRPEPNQAELTHAFRHVITQDVTYHLMPPAQRAPLHRAAALWYERVFAANLLPWHPLLAKHWSSADEPGKALEYLEKSAHDALRQYANEEVVRFLQHALQIDGRHPGHAAPLRRAVWRRLLGEALYNLGDHPRSRAEFRECLQLLGFPMPLSAWGTFFACLGEAFRQAFHRGLPAAWFHLPAAEQPGALEAARAYERLAEMMYMDNARIPTIYCAFRALNLSETQGPTAELARNYGNVTVVAGVLTLHRFARANAARARAVAELVQEPACTSYVNFLRGLYFVTVGHWSEAEHDLGVAVRIAGEIGARSRWSEGAATLMHVHLRQGKFSAAMELSVEMARMGQRFASPQGQVWGIGYQLFIRQIVADEPAAEARLRTELAALLRGHPDLPLADQTLGYGFLAWAQWERGEHSAAVNSAARMEQILDQTDQIAHYLIDAFLALSHLWVARIRSDPANRELRAEMLGRLRRQGRVLRRFRLMYPFGTGMAALAEGRVLSLSGREPAAARAWQAGLRSARKFGLRYYEALLCEALGASPALPEPARQAQRQKARELFTALGAQRAPAAPEGL